MRAGTRYILWGAAALIAAAAAGWLVAGRPSPERVLAHLPLAADAPSRYEAREPPLAVRTVAARTESVPISFTYTGTVIAQQDAEIRARVTGDVVERPFEPGGHVKKGQVMFRIDPRPFQVALKQAEAQRAQAEAQLKFARAEVERTDTLADKGYASEQRLQQQQSTAATASAQVQAGEAAIDRQKLNLDYAVVNAPFDGRASLSIVNPGDLVIENQTQLVTVVQVDPIDVQMALSSEDSEALREAMQGGPVTVEVLDEAGKPVREAKVYQLDNRFDPRTARRLVRALMPNADERFLPGQFVRARIKTSEEERLLVPSVALATQLAQQIVYVVDGSGLVHQRPVTTGDAFGEDTAILEGLKAGERVVVDHLQEMREGSRVRTRNEQADSRQGSSPEPSPAGGQ